MALIGEDCHYFITVGCTRGNQCCFRHQPAARTTEVPCPEWIQGKCLNANCGLRHIPVDRSRPSRPAGPRNVPCYFDSQPGGCLKAHCQFIHVNKGKSEVAPSTTPAAVVSTAAAVQPLPVAKPPPAHVEAVAPSQTPTPVVKPSTTNNVIPPPPAPVHSLPPAIGTPQIINGVLTIAPSRGILGATPVVPMQPQQQLLPPLGTQHVAVRPPIGQPPNQQIIHQPPVLAPQSNGYPKSGLFNEQVRLFKEMLSAKQKLKDPANVQKQYIDDEDDFSDDDDKKHRDNRQKSRKNRRDHRNNKSKKKYKDDWSKADKEVLYGDYKDVPVDRRSKGRSKGRHPGSDSELQVKSYEQVLREKALRKLMEKKKEKERFNDDFEDILQASDANRKEKSRKHHSDGEDTPDRKNRKKSIDLENEVFSKEDAVELGIEEDEFDTEIEKSKPKSRSRKRSKDNKPTKGTSNNKHSEKPDNRRSEEKNADKNSQPSERDDVAETKEEEEVATPVEGVLVIPDETTDLTFSVDDTDDLALELIQEPETTKTNRSKQQKKRTSGDHKKVSSIASVVAKKNDGKERKVDSQTSKPVAKVSGHKNQSKRKILVVDTDAETESKKNKDEIDSKLLEPKKVISLVRNEKKTKEPEKEPDSSKAATNIVKIKSFEEIMEEKRKRKLQLQDVVVVSDSDSTTKESPSKKPKESPSKKPKEVVLKERSEKFKSTVLVANKEKEKANVVDPPPKTAAQLRREKLQLAKQEYERRRKSQQLYQVKGTGTVDPVEETTAVSNNMTVPTAKKITLSKPAVSSTTAQTTSSGGGVAVRSFEEIMQEKRLRRQQEANKVQPKVNSKPIQSFLRRRSLSNQRNNQTDQPTEERTTQPNGTSITTTTTVINALETSTTTVQKVSLPSRGDGPTPVARIIGRRRSSSPSIVQVPQLETASVAPIKLKRKPSSSSSSDSKVPSSTPSPTSQELGSTIARTKSTAPLPTTVPTVLTKKITSDEMPNEAKVPDVVVPEEKEPLVQESSTSIQEALDEKKRIREEEMLDDDEFEKEMNDLLDDSDVDEDDDGADDVNDDDFMMELQQMIDS